MSKKRHTAPRSPRDARRTAPASIHERAYPSLRALLAAGAATALLSGCAKPTCESTSLDELQTHARAALFNARQLQLATATEDLSIALGTTPHPAIPPPTLGYFTGGAMISVSPDTLQDLLQDGVHEEPKPDEGPMLPPPRDEELR